jgi:SAM-dependent methyltransferase
MKQVDASHYRFSSYINKARFASFWHQVDEVLKFEPRTVLEIGPGPGIVTNILRKQGVRVTTVDFADDVGADIVASVLNLPFHDDEFDVVICCQVLEHLGIGNFPNALVEIRRVTAKGAVISLPHAGRIWPFDIYFPKIGSIRFSLKLQMIPDKHVFDGQHYWEIGKKGFSEKNIRYNILNIFGLKDDFRVHENPFHHFYICEKK